MSESEKPLRQQLADAMEKVRHQLDLLRSGPSIGGPLDDSSVIRDLKAEFEALKEAQANLSPEDR